MKKNLDYIDLIAKNNLHDIEISPAKSWEDISGKIANQSGTGSNFIKSGFMKIVVASLLVAGIVATYLFFKSNEEPKNTNDKQIIDTKSNNENLLIQPENKQENIVIDNNQDVKVVIEEKEVDQTDNSKTSVKKDVVEKFKIIVRKKIKGRDTITVFDTIPLEKNITDK